jgi:hypothetical protein
MTYKSKTLAAWLAVIGGAFGLHRLYLRGWADTLAWAHLPLALVGAWGVMRMRDLGQDDRLSWLLIPIFGLMIAQGMLHAITYALTPDERWDARHNPGAAARATRWGPILAAVTALLVGATVLMGSIAFAGQKFFEWQLEPSGPKAHFDSPAVGGQAPSA